jgi:hypothetical protein
MTVTAWESYCGDFKFIVKIILNLAVWDAVSQTKQRQHFNICCKNF